MPTSEPYNPLNDSDINPFLKGRGSAQQIRKRFISPAQVTSGGGNGVTSIDDPTYLGFSIRFDLSSPLFNGAAVGDPAKPPTEGFVNQALDILLATPPAADKPQDNNLAGESAVGYLKRVGEVTRASYLTSFIQGLREVNQFRPYYWQTIEGLGEAWTKSLLIADPYTGTTGTEGIKIGCLEAVDLKITALFNLYKAAVYDVKYKRMVLPKNLMYFDVYVDVYEIRQFKHVEGWLQKLNPSAPQPDVDRFLNENTSRLTFKFGECTWVAEESGLVYDSVTNVGGEHAKSAMKWTYSTIEMESEFSGYDQSLSDSAKLQTPGTLGSLVKDAAKNAGMKAANAALARAEQKARALAQGAILGNAFGLGNQVLGVLQNPAALQNAVIGAGGLLQPPTTQPRTPRLGDNPLGEGVQPGNSLPSESIFPGPPSSNSLSSSNVFGPGPSGPPPLNSNNVFG